MWYVYSQRTLTSRCPQSSGGADTQLRTHLEYIHLQILSVVSSTQLARAFARRSNFDPSRLLEGAYYFVPTCVSRRRCAAPHGGAGLMS